MQLAADAKGLLRALLAPELAPFLDEWPASSKQRGVEPKSLPVLRWLHEVREAAPPFSSQFINAVAEAAPRLEWRRSYSIAEVGAAFLENYGWTELMGREGPTPSEHLACGVLLLGPHVTYPPHWHEAEEIYVPLAGTAFWKCGSKGWRERQPGTVIHHARHESHAMRTGSSALLALYLWRSSNLNQKSRLVAANS
jgi:Dimethlysulfonioproprionate lyase